MFALIEHLNIYLSCVCINKLIYFSKRLPNESLIYGLAQRLQNKQKNDYKKQFSFRQIFFFFVSSIRISFVMQNTITTLLRNVFDFSFFEWIEKNYDVLYYFDFVRTSEKKKQIKRIKHFLSISYFFYDQMLLNLCFSFSHSRKKGKKNFFEIKIWI